MERCNRAVPRKEVGVDCVGLTMFAAPAVGHQRRSRQTFGLQTVGGSWVARGRRDTIHPKLVASSASP